ncbi:DUF2922 domain-containing protein [Clostridiaceae bacterium 35-E11]
MAEKRLEMIFTNQLGRTSKISVDNARDDLTELEVQTVMQTILDKNVFETTSGEFVAIDSARIVTTDVQEIIA